MLYYAIAMVCFCLSRGQAIQECPRVIIVGSGAAGIAAASRLLQNGFHNVTLLEAENRIGGRIYTDEFAGYLVDLGGQWIHGEEDNVAHELAWSLDLIDHWTGDLPTKVFSSSGSKIPDEAANELMEFYFNLTETEIPDKYLNESVGYYFKLKLDEYFDNHPEINTQQRPALEEMFNLYKMSAEAGDSWYDVSVKGLSEYTSNKGDHLMNWKDRGYSTILDILMKKLPNPTEELPVVNNTVFNAEVSQINYNASGGLVRVVTARGDEYTAEHVIVTTSLGVLKADYKTLFNPPLPEARVNVIKGLEIGTVAKIYLAYDKPWWTDRPTKYRTSLAIYWNEEERIKIANDPEKSWMLSVFHFISVEHKPRLLCIWLTGVHARAMEKIPEERVFELIKLMIHQFFGKSYNISEPTSMRRTQWFTNKHFRGCYSYRSLETERSGVMARDLSEPITENEKPVILFAGEATSPNYYSTVQGAISTGWREADRLIEFYTAGKFSSELSGSDTPVGIVSPNV